MRLSLETMLIVYGNGWEGGKIQTKKKIKCNVSNGCTYICVCEEFCLYLKQTAKHSCLQRAETATGKMVAVINLLKTGCD